MKLNISLLAYSLSILCFAYGLHFDYRVMEYAGCALLGILPAIITLYIQKEINSKP